jgi:CRISPR/Cas system CMR subunit Cmr6 (Cas7 group RAMP superfamily)
MRLQKSEIAQIRDKSIKEWLKEALTNHGIGAKTAVGYGYFE